MTDPGFALALADARDAALAGGKGASLGELSRAGLAVPPGFVVTVDGFTAAMAAIDPSGALRAQLEALGDGDPALLARACAALRARVTETPLPARVADAVTAGYAALADDAGAAANAAGPPDAALPAVAVRSSATLEDSATASFAGLQDTYLGVSGAPAVLEHVRRCWASLYNEESVAYRRRLGLPERGPAMAVVVQRMVAPRAAGVMFTRSPVTGDRSVVAIEGVWGLGSALVSGDVTPDSFIVSKITGEITTRRVSPKLKTHTRLPNARVAPSGLPAESPPEQDAAAGSAAAVGWPLPGGTAAPAGAAAGVEPSTPGGTAAPAGSAAAVGWPLPGGTPAPDGAAAGVEPSTPGGTPTPDGAAAGVEPSIPVDASAALNPHGPGITVVDTPAQLRDAPCLTDEEIRALAAIARQVEAHYGAPQDIEWALLESDDSPDAANSPAGPPTAFDAPGTPRIVLLQSRPETVWAAKERAPAGAPKPRPADHVLALFGKPL